MKKIRGSIILRYKLLPYIYTAFYNYYKLGIPILKPLWYYNTNKDYLFNAKNQFYFGESLLIRPVLSLEEHDKNE